LHRFDRQKTVQTVVNAEYFFCRRLLLSALMDGRNRQTLFPVFPKSDMTDAVNEARGTVVQFFFNGFAAGGGVDRAKAEFLCVADHQPAGAEISLNKDVISWLGILVEPVSDGSQGVKKAVGFGGQAGP
jgi:hypothetical protein